MHVHLQCLLSPANEYHGYMYICSAFGVVVVGWQSAFVCAGENDDLQSALSAARQAERDALASVQRLETELSDLASAYNNVELQSYQLEAQIKRLQNQADQPAASAGQH